MKKDKRSLLQLGFQHHKEESICFLTGLFLSILIFWHRWARLTTSMPLPDNDYEGTLWNIWFQAFSMSKGMSYFWNNYFSYPYFSDLSYMPVENLFFDLFSGLLAFFPRDLQTIVTLTNLYGLLTYPLCAWACFKLLRDLDCKALPAFIGGTVFTFSFDHIMSGRGIMVFGSYFLMPLVFLYVKRLIEKPVLQNCLKFSFVYGLQLAIDAYYGFYVAIFGGSFGLVLMLFHILRRDVSLVKLWSIIKYSFISILIIIVINAKNLMAYADMFFSSESRQLISRNLDMSTALAPIKSFFLPSASSFVFSKVSNVLPSFQNVLEGGSLLSYTAILLAIIGLLHIRRQSSQRTCISLTFLFFGIISVAIASNVAWGESLRSFYFEYFGLFRSVGRLNRMMSLSLGVLAGIGSSYLIGGLLNQWEGLVKTLVTSGILVFAIVMEGLNTDPSWKQTFDVRNIIYAYQPLKADSVQSVIAFPRNGPYMRTLLPMQLGQIVHEKRIVGSLDPRSPYWPYLLQPNAITSDLIDQVAHQGIDSIIVYDKLYQYSLGTAPPAFLAHDPRLQLLSHVSHKYPIEGQNSLLAESLEMSIYQIKPQFVSKPSIQDFSIVGKVDKELGTSSSPLPSRTRFVSMGWTGGGLTFDIRELSAEKSGESLLESSNDYPANRAALGVRSAQFYVMLPELMTNVLGYVSAFVLLVIACYLLIIKTKSLMLKQWSHPT